MSSLEVAGELAKALGTEVQCLTMRQTNDKQTAVIDAICLFTGQTPHDAAQTLRRLLERHPELKSRMAHFKFPGRGQRDTIVTDLATLYEILMLLPGRMAAQSRRQAAQLMIRYLGGDLTLIAEVEENRKLQERLAAEDPNHPLRQFGVAVEATMDLEPTEVIHPEDSETDPKGDFLYGMRVPGEPTVLKVGRTHDITKRERALSCGQVQPFRATLVFPGAGPLEKHVHRRLQGHQVQNEVFRITPQMLKDAVKIARKDYDREQYMEELRAQMSPSDSVDDAEEREPTSNKRRRLAEDLEIERQRVALEHTKAMNALELEERRMSLQEREADLKAQATRLAMEIEERRARLQMEIQDRATHLSETKPPVDKSPLTDEPTTTAMTSGPDHHKNAQNMDEMTRLLGPFELVRIHADATPKGSLQYRHRMERAQMPRRQYNAALRSLGFEIERGNHHVLVKKDGLCVRLL